MARLEDSPDRGPEGRAGSGGIGTSGRPDGGGSAGLASAGTLTAGVTGAGAALLSALASACCAPVLAPLLVAALGASGAVWVTGLKPYAPHLLGFAALALAFGFWTLRRERKSCPIGAAGKRSRNRLMTTFLWLAAGVWMISVLWTISVALHLLPTGP